MVKTINLLEISAMAIVAVSVPGTASAYITPGQFLGEEPASSSSSSASSVDETPPIPDLVPDSGADVVIPELVPDENASGAHDDARAGLIQGNGYRRPSNFSTQNLPSNVTRDTRIPDRPTVAETTETEAAERPTRRAIQESVQTVERAHGAASNLPPSGLPLALPAILTLISAGTSFYTFRKIRNASGL